jgi:hypothetical protein
MVRWVRAGVVSAALAGMIALAGAVLGRIFADALLAQLLAGSAVGSVGLSLAARRLPNWVVAPMSAVALGGYTILALSLAAARAELTTPLPQIARDALANGIPRLLTAMIPVESTPDTVVVPVVAAWLAGLAGAEVAVRAGRVLLGLLPPVALYAVALYVVGPNADTAGWTTLLFAGLAVAALAAGARADPAATLTEVPAPARAAVRGRRPARRRESWCCSPWSPRSARGSAGGWRPPRSTRAAMSSRRRSTASTRARSTGSPAGHWTRGSACSR